jgi:hypothetical protein
MKRVVVSGFAVLLLIGLWILFQRGEADAYEGMSIIPEEHEDIPLYKGLKPREVQYEIDGNQWEDIYDFYVKELPKHGWRKEYIQSALDDDDPENDWSGFISRWGKEGFDGYLWVFGNYDQLNDKTEVRFDKTPLLTASEWFAEMPESICIYDKPDDKNCTEIHDKEKIKGIINLINTAFDTEKPAKLENTSVIEISGQRVEVHYEEGQEIFLKSEKGLKYMKPEQEFFEYTNLPYEMQN